MLIRKVYALNIDPPLKDRMNFIDLASITKIIIESEYFEYDFNHVQDIKVKVLQVNV